MNVLSYMKLIIAGVMLAIVLGAAFYIKNLRADLKVQEQNVLELKRVKDKQQAVIAQQKIDYSKIILINKLLVKNSEKLQKDNEALNKKFNYTAAGHSRDLGAITRVKPALINKIVNTATDKVNRCFELATGAVLKENENNNECKELINILRE